MQIKYKISRNRFKIGKTFNLALLITYKGQRLHISANISYLCGKPRTYTTLALKYAKASFVHFTRLSVSSDQSSNIE